MASGVEAISCSFAKTIGSSCHLQVRYFFVQHTKQNKIVIVVASFMEGFK
jgi:hypothetical protein